MTNKQRISIALSEEEIAACLGLMAYHKQLSLPKLLKILILEAGKDKHYCKKCSVLISSEN